MTLGIGINFACTIDQISRFCYSRNSTSETTSPGALDIIASTLETAYMLACSSALAQLERVRQQTERLCEPLETEDYCIQPMLDASPPKWHLAHTTWFFETFVLKHAVPNYQVFDSAYEYLFNSYYDGIGTRHPRSDRGLLSRPLVSEIYAYRKHVDDALQSLLAGTPDTECLRRIELGLHHEQQHQELLITDLKCNLGRNPIHPIYLEKPSLLVQPTSVQTTFIEHSGRMLEIGAELNKNPFCFDNELPRHSVWLAPYAIADRLVTNGEYLEFILDGGYETVSLWLSDGWGEKVARGWKSPEYWFQEDGEWLEYALHGVTPVDLESPVCHVSYFEADAYARWIGARLPTEFEWEAAAQTADHGERGTFAEDGHFHPRPQSPTFCGDCWQWTSSSYAPYPGYQPLEGTLGEYNGKFMANQYVLRGGSCATPVSHYRNSYRNFFYSKDRWQFTGIRLGRNLDN